MANVKFTDLPNLANITASTIIPVVDANVNYSVTTANLQSYVNNSTGNISTTGNITGNYFIGNGSQLTGIVSSYGDSNVAAFLPTYTGNITATNISSVGNVSAVNFAGNGSQLTGIVSSYGNSNVAAYLPTYTGNLNPNIVSATGNITAPFFFGNGSQLTGLPATYSDSNVVSLLSAFGSNNISTTGNIIAGTFTGNGAGLTNLPAGILSGNLTGNIAGNGFSMLNIATITSAGTISATGNITGANITGTHFGNGGQLSNIVTSIVAGSGISVNNATGVVTVTNNNPTPYTNANVAAYLPTNTSNVSGNFFIGNGSLLTGISSNYSNANVVNLLAAFGSNTISTTGTVTAGNLRTTGTISAGGNVTLSSNLLAYAELTAGPVNTSTSFTPVYSTGIVQRITATANFTLNAPTGMVTGSSITLIITQDATGSRLMTPNVVYKFAYGLKTLSTTANSIDMLSIFYDGSNYLCNMVKGYA